MDTLADATTDAWPGARPHGLVLADELRQRWPGRRASELLRARVLRQVTRGVYTTDLDTPLQRQVSQAWWVLAGHWFPGALVNRRSAVPGRIAAENTVHISHGRSRQLIRLHGFSFVTSPGRRPISEAPCVVNDHLVGQIYVASRARCFLENLETDADHPADVMGMQWMEAELLKIYQREGYGGLLRLCLDASGVASYLGMPQGGRNFACCLSRLMRHQGL